MSIRGKIALFVGGTLFGSAGLKILGSRDAKKVYTHVTAATLRCKDEILKNMDLIQENCSDILSDAKAINSARTPEETEKVIQDASET